MQLSIVKSYQVTDERGLLHAQFTDEKDAEKYIKDREPKARRVKKLGADCRGSEWITQGSLTTTVTRYRYNRDTAYWEYRHEDGVVGPWRNSRYSAPELKYGEYVEAKPRKVKELTHEHRDAQWLNEVTGSTYRYSNGTWQFKDCGNRPWINCPRTSPRLGTHGKYFVEVVN